MKLIKRFNERIKKRNDKIKHNTAKTLGFITGYISDSIIVFIILQILLLIALLFINNTYTEISFIIQIPMTLWVILHRKR